MEELEYTVDDYLSSAEPYESIYRLEKFARTQRYEKVKKHAESLGIKNFKKIWDAFENEMNEKFGVNSFDNESNFSGQPLALKTGTWQTSDSGILKPGDKGPLVACSHPLIPIERLNSIDTNVEKIRLAFRRGRNWKTLICDKKTISSNNSILELSNSGIGVNSSNAQYMVKYLADVESLNYEDIPEVKSTSKLGWTELHGFSPYVDNLVFDGEDNFKAFFDSVAQSGSYDEWLDMAKSIRAGSRIAPRIILASSFASALVEPLGGLPFFVHLWGGTEVGKTVGLMLAASVWANPEMGRYIHSFNSTAVAQELSASFVNSLPLILDELQMIKDKKDFDQMIYQLCEGVGKGRGQKSGGLQKVGTWRNCILTSGEQPISSASSGGGAVNRIVEIECTDKLFSNPRRVASCVKSNYGYAGKDFIEQIQKDGNLELARELQHGYQEAFNKLGATEKQSLAASLIITADALADMLIFKDNNCMLPKDIMPYLSDKDSVSEGFRALEWLKGWIAENTHRFDLGSPEYRSTGRAGRIDSDQIVIIRKVFNDICKDAGFNSTSFASWLKKNGYSDTEVGRTDKTVRIDGMKAKAIVLDRGRID